MSELTASGVWPRAKSALAFSSVHALRELKVEQVNGALLISGSVSSFYHKQLAQEAVRVVAGSVEVVNSVYVQDAH
jgi:osmotically-inducible protein OsmY